MQEAATVKSIISGRNRDCWACKIISASGLIGSGLYVAYHSKRFQKNVGKSIMYSIGSALILLGTARLFDLPPFRKQFNHG